MQGRRLSVAGRPAMSGLCPRWSGPAPSSRSCPALAELPHISQRQPSSRCRRPMSPRRSPNRHRRVTRHYRYRRRLKRLPPRRRSGISRAVEGDSVSEPVSQERQRRGPAAESPPTDRTAHSARPCETATPRPIMGTWLHVRNLEGKGGKRGRNARAAALAQQDRAGASRDAARSTLTLASHQRERGFLTATSGCRRFWLPQALPAGGNVRI
jgi:hypothetical protein